jgi:hemerythrin
MKTNIGFLDRIPMMQHALAGLVRWDDRLSIGNPAIDAQHRAIFNLVGEVDALWRGGASVTQWRGIADKANRILETHFRYEELVLAEAGYPALAEHARQHDAIRADLAAIRAYLNGSEAIGSEHAGLRLSNFILGVTMGHGINSDSDYCRYITEETAKESTGCA